MVEHMNAVADHYFIAFKETVCPAMLPDKFTFPFNYKPHTITVKAIKHLQNHLRTQTDWKHDFGIDHHVDGVNVGKMFGVLVVEYNNIPGYLWAFSGKLAEQNVLPKFVPPIANKLTGNGFFEKESKAIGEITRQINDLKSASAYKKRKKDLILFANKAHEELKIQKNELKKAKRIRNINRQMAKKQLSSKMYKSYDEKLCKESLDDHFQQKDLSKYWKVKINDIKIKSAEFETEIERLKNLRKEKSVKLQQRLFEAYKIPNIKGETKSLKEIFGDETNRFPPAGAGECAMPKLLNFAFLHKMKPIAMAEFWWGQSPKSEIREHGNFYPSCQRKCRPILRHMLDGIELERNQLNLKAL